MEKFYERYWQHEEELEDFSYKWPAIESFIPKGERIKLLDFGCGKGKILKEVLKINPHLRITGVDISQKAIAFIKKQLPDHAFYKIEEGQKLPFASGSFNYILALDILEHIYDTEFIFSELARVLAPGSRMLITVPYYGLIKNLIITLVAFDVVYDPRSQHIRFYTKKSLLREVKGARLLPLQVGYFGRFYPVSKGMFCLCEKPKRKPNER